MARAGLRGLEFYDPETGKHGQAHMQARFVPSTYTKFPPKVQWPFSCSLGITQHLIKGGIARLEEVRDVDGNLEDLLERALAG